MKNSNQVLDTPTEQSVELLNQHHVLDAHMYQAMQMMQGDHPELKDAVFSAGRVMSKVRNPNVITAKAYLWGFHIAIPEKPLKELYTASDIVAAFTSLAGATFGAAFPPVAIIAAVVAALIEAEKVVITSIDGGNGVYLSWSWLQVPLLYIPPFAQPVITRIKG